MPSLELNTISLKDNGSKLDTTLISLKVVYRNLKVSLFFPTLYISILSKLKECAFI